LHYALASGVIVRFAGWLCSILVTGLVLWFCGSLRLVVGNSGVRLAVLDFGECLAVAVFGFQSLRPGQLAIW